MNYWEEPDVTKAQLQEWFAEVVSYVEGVHVPPNHLDDLNVEQLKERIALYEYVAEK